MFVSIIAFIVVLGILIFVHELGHFLVAKRFNVGVEKFSLGFGPKLIARQYGETEYRVSAVPLGGYVKMVGEDPEEPLAPEDRERSFNNQALFKRFLIVAAGPASNILFAVLVFAGMFMIGYPSEDTTIGLVEQGSPAWEAGIRPGDRVLAVDGDAIRLWEELSRHIRESEGAPLSLRILQDATERTVLVQPLMADGKNLFGEKETLPHLGIQHHTLAPVVGVSDPASPAGRHGFQTGDRIVSVNAREVDSFPSLERAVSGILGPALQFEVVRDEKERSLTVLLDAAEIQHLTAERDRVLEGLGFSPADLFVHQVQSDSAAEAAGIAKGDRIVAIAGERISSFSTLQEVIGENPGNPLALTLIRQGETLSVTVTPQAAQTKDALGNKISIGRIGIQSSFYPKPGPTLSVRYNPVQASVKALGMTWEITELIMVSLVKLIQQVIPAETIGGPILIAQLAGQQIQYGILELFKFMALISINLGILNLLPIPILDGGHILFFAVEGLMGRPLSMRKREIAQQVGLFLLISLMVFAFYNDLMRVFE